MMRILFVSIALPPKNDPESLQSAKYLKYISKNIDVDIVTSSSPTLWMPFDNTLKDYIKDVKQVITIRIIEPMYLSIFINKLFRRFAKPDTRLTFHLQSNKVIKELKIKPDVIYSRAFPLSSILMAKKLKKHYNVPWVLHLSDPWVESPLFDYNNSKYHQNKEKECFKEADIISFTSLSTIEIYNKKYPQFRSKFEYYPNVYDDEDIIKELPNLNNSKVKLVYTGSLNGSRSLRLLVEAIKIVNQKDSNFLNTIEVIVAGSLDSENKKIIDNNSKFINYVGFLSIIDVKKLQRNADILLAVDFDFKKAEEAIFFPSKLLDYFITKKPILAITNKNSTTDKLLKDAGHFCVYHNDCNELVKLLLNIDTIKESTYEIPLKFSAFKNTERLVKLFKIL